MSTPPKYTLAFDEWWSHLKFLAGMEKFKLYPDRDAYQEYWVDGDSPADTLKIEMQYYCRIYPFKERKLN